MPDNNLKPFPTIADHHAEQKRKLTHMKRFMSIQELAESDILPGKSTVSAIRGLVHKRQIPFRKIGGKVYFIKSEIENWLLSRSAGNPYRGKIRPEVLENAAIERVEARLNDLITTINKG